MKKKNVITHVWKHWKSVFGQSKISLIGVILTYSGAMYLELMFRPIQWKTAFDQLANKQSPWEAFKYVAIASILGWALNRAGDAFVVVAESRLIRDLKNYSIRGLLGKSTHFFTNHPSGALVAKYKRFASVSEYVVDEFVFSIIRSCFFVLYLIVYSWIVIPKFALVFAIWTTLFVLTTVFFSRIRMKYDLESANADSATIGHTSDILLSIFTLRMFSAVPQIQKTFEQVTQDEYRKRRKAWFFGNMQWASQSILVIALELYCMSTVLGDVIAGYQTIGTAVLVQAYIASLSMYMWGLGRSIVKVRTSFADAYEMSELLSEENYEPIEYEPSAVVPKSNGISFSGVTFGYKTGTQALSDFTFNFIAGRRYGIVGKTGSGKSTLTKLMLGVYDQHRGMITVCDEPVDCVNKLLLRSWISYVPQDPQFPSWSVRNIIAMGKPNASFAEIKSAAEKASCDFIWEKLSDGFETKIGERGIKLSGGERQRLAIAAAILKDAPIVIMDEPTSALDAHTEQSIQKAIGAHFVGKTLIVIAHRLSTVAILDEIILLENGTVKDVGPHDALLQTSTDYKEMWELQTNPQII